MHHILNFGSDFEISHKLCPRNNIVLESVNS